LDKKGSRMTEKNLTLQSWRKLAERGGVERQGGRILSLFIKSHKGRGLKEPLDVQVKTDVNDHRGPALFGGKEEG